MSRTLRRAGKALVSADALAIAGAVLLAVGAWMAWPPAGPLLAGVLLLSAARSEAR